MRTRIILSTPAPFALSAQMDKRLCVPLSRSLLHRRVRGATLMEVLITMVIMLFGLLGLSQLFIKAQRTTTDAYDRHRALSLANQMAEGVRSMIRSKPTSGAGFVSGEVCPTAGQVPTDGILTNEQLMACFADFSKVGANHSLGKLSNETAVSEPSTLKASLTTCSTAPGCDGRSMVLYMLNNWTEALAGYRQGVTPGSGSVYSAKGFTARGCIDKILESNGCVSGCTSSTRLPNVYRVRVFWRGEEAVSPDDSRNYCGNTPDSFMRYTFVDVSLPTPSIVPLN